MPETTVPAGTTKEVKTKEVKVDEKKDKKPKIEKLSDKIMNPADVIANKVNEIIDVINK